MSGTIRLIGGVVTYLCTHDSQLQSCELESTNEQLKLAHARRSLTVGRTRCSDGMNTKKYHFAKEWYYNLRSYEWSYKQLKKKKKKKTFLWWMVGSNQSTSPTPCTAFARSLLVNSLVRLDHVPRNAWALRNNDNSQPRNPTPTIAPSAPCRIFLKHN